MQPPSATSQAPPWHTLPQALQLLGSSLVLVQAYPAPHVVPLRRQHMPPSDATPQSAALPPPQVQIELWHEAPSSQTTPQPPQFFGLSVRSTQVVGLACGQPVWPAPQPRVHAPAPLQRGSAELTPAPQTPVSALPLPVEQPPQSLGFELVSVQAKPLPQLAPLVPAHSPPPGATLQSRALPPPQVQTEFWHEAPGSQAIPQPPQLLGSFVRFAQEAGWASGQPVRPAPQAAHSLEPSQTLPAAHSALEVQLVWQVAPLHAYAPQGVAATAGQLPSLQIPGAVCVQAPELQVQEAALHWLAG